MVQKCTLQKQLIRTCLLSLCLILCGRSYSFAQKEKTSGFFDHYRFTSAGGGLLNYLGELDDNHTLKFSTPGFQVLHGFKFRPHWKVRVQLAGGMLRAADAESADPRHQIRNLSFRSPLFEIAGIAQYEPFARMRKYHYRNKWSPYVLAGVSGFIFNPQAKLDGDWVSLQHLGTEGQYLPGAGVRPYSRIQFALPMGAGVRIKVSQQVDLYAELLWRKTFTDYLDDVSGNYPDLQLLQTGNPTAFLLSDRIDKTRYPEGAAYWYGARGNSKTADGYATTNLGVAFLIDWEPGSKYRR